MITTCGATPAGTSDDRRVLDGLLATTGLVDLGVVSDAQLGALAPSPIGPGSWWSAGTVAQPPDATRAGDEPGRTGTATGAQLRGVRSVLRTACAVVTWDDGHGRGAFVIADDVVLVDRIAEGRHHLQLADLPVAVTLLAIGLDPYDVARPRRTGVAAVDVLAAADVATMVPDPRRRSSTIRLARVSDGPPPSECIVTVIATGDGVTAWRALPSGRVSVSSLDRDGVVAAALALLAPSSSPGSG